VDHCDNKQHHLIEKKKKAQEKRGLQELPLSLIRRLISKYTNDKRKALIYTVELYKKGVWTTGRAEEWEEGEGEEFGFEAIDNDTTDDDTE